jgi:predicted alpha/beta superfamily hydrolase
MPRKKLQLITDTDDDRPIYVAGSFNAWRVAEELYRLHPGKEAGQWEVNLELPEDTLFVEYKYTRGGWECVELGKTGETGFNHRRYLAERWTLPDRVTNWASAGLHYQEKFLPLIAVIDEAFEIPQLIRTRRVAALLPHDYHETDKRYPVLYLQDGQNLFDDNAPFGSWGVDKQLAAMAERGVGDLIVIAIDHANAQRTSEFTPSVKTKLGKGDGEAYCHFLARNLKPHVDAHFRTLPDSANTGIGGSSMGGLISLYAGLLYPSVYDRLMVFSPSFWVMPNIPFQLMKLSHHFHGRVYLYGGAAESKTMVPNMVRFREELTRQAMGKDLKFRTEIDPEGQHNEARWGREFPKAVEWLFFSQE